MESEDDGNLLNQAIAAGVNKPKQDGATSVPINIPLKPRPSTELCNESISSVDSCGKDEANNSILEQCIRSGINKVVKKESHKPRVLVTSSPKKSLLPTYNKPGPSKPNKIEKKLQDRKDEELLNECITTGILKTTRNDQHTLVQNFAHLSMSEPKNVESTSVIVMDKHQCASTITGVEAKVDEIKKKVVTTSRTGTSSSTKNENRDRDENFASRNELSLPANWITPNGSSTSFDLNLSLGSIEDNILERSNEYPAAKLSMGAYSEFDDDSVMEVSNEFMMENEKLSEAKIEDKHKDPDLMMKSVDRLTQELVSTAEYLRKASNTISDENSLEQKMSGSISNNNTWNDENSFPSISMSAPMIGSTNDEATIATDQIYPMPVEDRIPEENQMLNDKTPTNENYTFNVKEDEADGPLPKIEFKVGGEIGAAALNKINFGSYGPTSIETNSTMSNSTIVQVEAKRIANKLTSMTNRLMDSTTSLDLENVRPPSSMDCISMCSFQESSIQQSPFKQPKKALMTGFVAKRALSGQMFSASVESINSIHNIDSIRPPSIMDELLDSMISVDSIVSEMVDPTTMGISNYETALSDPEDSLTLRSCQDLSKDDALTLTSSDFSSVESTPKKKRSTRAMTPKQKRQAEKDRYMTYTIQVDMLLKEQQENKQETSSIESMRRSMNARQRRQDDRQRFETQVISHSPTRNVKRKGEPERFKTFNIESTEADDDKSIRAMTDNFEFLRNNMTPVNGVSVDTAGIRIKLNRIKSGGSPTTNRTIDDSLEYERQNSETESQRDLKNSLSYDADSSVEPAEDSPVSTPTPTPAEPPKIRPAKTSYISPYRMTTRISPIKNNGGRVTKSPIIAKPVMRTTGNDSKSAQKVIGKTVNVAASRLNTAAKSAAPKMTNIPKTATTPTQLKEPPAMPIRQGTFIQDEPTLENVPVVTDLSPVKTPVSKLKQPTRISSASKIPTTPTSPKKASNLPSTVSQLKFRSNSNASMKSPIPTPIRSNTGINLIHPKKNVSSKIAGIWKSADKKESSLKQPISKSNTQLNCNLKLSTPAGTNGRKLVNGVGKDRIKRSSTCDEIGEIS